MSDGKNVLKLPGDYIDFNLNLKTILSPLFDAQKSIYALKKNQKNPKQTKKLLKLLIFWSHLLHPTFPSDTKYRGTREIMSSEFHFVIHQFVESSSYRFSPTLKSLCDYFRNGCAFYKMQIIPTKSIVAFVFNHMFSEKHISYKTPNYQFLHSTLN